ncbi:DegV family protein [Apilactobacillus micheneri]|uniref:DegV family protein n=1 Tax=Apilactobacillus micheneri TaxID=1899430 RepID=A0A9Q8MU91_9LACO|nr:DegV family protein [Apilactobacillus micheneri]TPR40985.1 DegV family protein [Apilactobacillus micheneri]TPR42565.1 DegV family protein [Apilactobacillus micheneri]TPR45534.1 DegV family protein [Apilactobacillus micheneri]TPR46092.1 DegV family protein [Apilactobacillus micheneri]TPR46777.1 DegV family protein [Apilactobacillus micheneri]
MIKIVTDSTALIPDKIVKELGIKVIPLNVSIGEQSFKDDIDINGKKLIKNLEDNPKGDFPITSQPSIGDFVELYNSLTANGDTVLSIHMTDLLSGTVHAAQQAAQIADGTVKVINTHFIDQSLGHIVTSAAKLANSNEYNLDEISAAVDKMIENSNLYIGASTLENLVRGGRISKAKGIISKLINLHVIFEVLPKDMDLQVKGRGKKTFTKWLDKYCESVKDEQFEFIGISYTGDDTFPLVIKKRLGEMFPDAEISMLYTSAIVATHTGNDAFAVMTCKKWS